MKKVAIGLLLICATAFAQQKGSFTDKRDGKTYKTAKIGEQTWMAENLNYNANGSKCYENQESNCQKYGRLYNWNTAKTVCPKGWHLPSDAEWNILITAVGGEKTAGKHLKAKSGWNNNGNKSGNGTDIYGFAALPGGVDYFSILGDFGFWWSATEGDADNAYYRSIDGEYDGIYRDKTGKDDNFFSVRCVQD